MGKLCKNSRTLMHMDSDNLRPPLILICLCRTTGLKTGSFSEKMQYSYFDIRTNYSSKSQEVAFKKVVVIGYYGWMSFRCPSSLKSKFVQLCIPHISKRRISSVLDNRNSHTLGSIRLDSCESRSHHSRTQNLRIQDCALNDF